jgi:hypothetical protein
MSVSSTKTVVNWPLCFFLLGVLGCLYLNSFILPGTPIYQGDDTPIFLLDARRMLAGQVMYRDFFELTLPGISSFYLALFKLFGTRAWIPAAAFVLQGLSLAWLGVAISKRIITGSLAFLPSLLFVGLAFITERDPTHHWLSTAAVLAGLVVLIEKRTPARIAVMGLWCGVSTLFTQTRGPAACVGVALFLLWEARTRRQSLAHFLKAQVYLWAPFLATVLGILSYVVLKTGWAPFAFCTIVFPAKYWNLWYWGSASVYLSEVPLLSGVLEVPAVGVWLSIHLLVPLVYLLFLVRWMRLRKVRPDEPWDRLMLVSFVGIFLFLSVAFSANWVRLCSVSLPGLIVLAWFVKSSGRLCGPLAKLLWGCGLGVLAAQTIVTQTDWRATLEAPVGRAAFLEPDRYQKFKWVAGHTRPGDFFFQGSDCDLLYLLDLRDPAKVPFVTLSGFTPSQQVADVIDGLDKRRVQFVLWSVWLDVPLHPQRGGDPLPPLRKYLKDHYHVVGIFGEPDYEQVWERNQ